MRKNSKKRSQRQKTRRSSPRSTAPSASKGGPVTLAQAKALARMQVIRPKSGMRRRALPKGQVVAVPGTEPPASLRNVAHERKKLHEQYKREHEERIREYTATMKIMKKRGVKGLTPASPRRAPGAEATVMAAARPLQIFAEGDSWFDYPVPLFGGGIITRLEKLVGLPILNLAKAGDEVRFMMGVQERKVVAEQLRKGCPAGGPWDALLFSGGGNDVVDNPMALWVKDFDPAIPVANHIDQIRFNAVLTLLRAGYEDLIAMRDSLSPTTHLVFHAYDFAIPDGRGICGFGPWLKPTFDLRGFPRQQDAFEVVKVMLQQFAALLQSLVRPGVTFINAQATLSPQRSSWHNELHPAKAGFDSFARMFYEHLRVTFPGRVL